MFKRSEEIIKMFDQLKEENASMPEAHPNKK